MAKKHMKRCSTSLVIRNGKLKPQWGPTTHPIRGAKIKKTDHTRCWWCGGPGTLICCWWEIKCCNILENSLTVSYKVKWTLTMWSSQSKASYLPKRKESTCPHKDLYTNVHSSFVCNGPKLETTQISFSRWMDIHSWVVYPYNGILLSNKKEWTIDTCYITWMNFKIVMLSERSQEKSVILYDSI